MKKMSKVFAIVFLVIAATAFYGVFFQGATWHIVTGFFGLFAAMLFYSDVEKPAQVK